MYYWGCHIRRRLVVQMSRQLPVTMISCPTAPVIMHKVSLYGTVFNLPNATLPYSLLYVEAISRPLWLRQCADNSTLVSGGIGVGSSMASPELQLLLATLGGLRHTNDADDATHTTGGSTQ